MDDKGIYVITKIDLNPENDESACSKVLHMSESDLEITSLFSESIQKIKDEDDKSYDIYYINTDRVEVFLREPGYIYGASRRLKYIISLEFYKYNKL